MYINGLTPCEEYSFNYIHNLSSFWNYKNINPTECHIVNFNSFNEQDSDNMYQYEELLKLKVDNSNESSIPKNMGKIEFV